MLATVVTCHPVETVPLVGRVRPHRSRQLPSSAMTPRRQFKMRPVIVLVATKVTAPAKPDPSVRGGLSHGRGDLALKRRIEDDTPLPVERPEIHSPSGAMRR